MALHVNEHFQQATSYDVDEYEYGLSAPSVVFVVMHHFVHLHILDHSD